MQKNNIIIIALLALATPLFLANWLSVIIAIGWLLYLGDFQTLLYAAIGAVIVPFALALAMIPSMVFAIPAGFLLKKGGILKIFSYPFLLIAGLWMYVLIGGWVLYVFHYCIGLAEIKNAINLPYIFLAYAISTAPFSYMASKEPNQNFGATIALTTNQVSSLAMLILIGFTNIKAETVGLIFIIIMLIGFLIAISAGALSETNNLKKDDDEISN